MHITCTILRTTDADDAKTLNLNNYRAKSQETYDI